MRYIKLALLVFLSSLTFISFSAEQEADNKHNNEATLASSLKKLGEGQMSILFWKVYKAEFYSSETPYNENAYPKALKLTYQRDIEKAEFVDATQDQWIKLNANYKTRLVTEEQESLWLNELNNIFPDIKENDIILLTLNKNKEANFYLKKHKENNNKTLDNSDDLIIKSYQLIGSILEPTFGDYFLSIWLSKHTTEPKLRKKLIGE